MADDSGQSGLRERIARQGEDALGKVAQELLENPLVNSAITRAFDARERAAKAQEATLGALNIPSAADVERLTRRLRSVSQRMEGIEEAVDRLDSGLRAWRRRAPAWRSGSERSRSSSASSRRDLEPHRCALGAAARTGAVEGRRGRGPEAEGERRRSRARRRRDSRLRRRTSTAAGSGQRRRRGVRCGWVGSGVAALAGCPRREMADYAVVRRHGAVRGAFASQIGGRRHGSAARQGAIPVAPWTPYSRRQGATDRRGVGSRLALPSAVRRARRALGRRPHPRPPAPALTSARSRASLRSAPPATR